MTFFWSQDFKPNTKAKNCESLRWSVVHFSSVVYVSKLATLRLKIPWIRLNCSSVKQGIYSWLCCALGLRVNRRNWEEQKTSLFLCCSVEKEINRIEIGKEEIAKPIYFHVKFFKNSMRFYTREEGEMGNSMLKYLCSFCHFLADILAILRLRQTFLYISTLL